MRASFYRRNAWWLASGLALTFASGFGQTYFISLFAGEIRAAFDLSNGAWGGLYTIATFASAVCLFQFGGLADTVPLARLAAACLVLYALAAVTMAATAGPLMLTLAVFGLRFCGQGMMSHLAMTAMARWFRANRGRALAVAILGFPLGEALYPLLAVRLAEAAGWRTTWLIVAAATVGILLPALFLLLRRGRTPQGEGAGDSAVGMDRRHWTRREVVRHWSLWAILPAVLAPPFIATCAIFHQVHIAELRGYALPTMAAAFPLYAAVSITGTLLGGTVMDRRGPLSVLPLFLLPLTAGIALLAVPAGVGIWFAVLAGIAFSQGIAGTLFGVLWPTLYGTRHIGAIKALTTSAMVFSTAVGPGLTGILIDLGIAFPEQAPVLAAYCLAVSAVLRWVVTPRLAERIAVPSAGLVGDARKRFLPPERDEHVEDPR